MTGYKWFSITHCLIPCPGACVWDLYAGYRGCQCKNYYSGRCLSYHSVELYIFLKPKLNWHCKSTRYVCIHTHACTSTYMHLFAMLHIKIALCRSGNEALKSSSVKWLTINWSDFSNKVTKQWQVWEHLNIGQHTNPALTIHSYPFMEKWIFFIKIMIHLKY